MATKTNGRYVIVRTYSAGVFAGNLESKIGQEVILTDARRLWYWAGAASLSQLAVEGTSRPKDCKFPIAVPRIELTQAIEIIDVTRDAETSIKAVPIWRAE
jgi:hypothetical protein